MYRFAAWYCDSLPYPTLTSKGGHALRNLQPDTVYLGGTPSAFGSSPSGGAKGA